MNVLQTSPYAVVEPGALEQYYEELERQSFDTACTTFHLCSHAELVGPLAPAYADFARESRRRGYPACIRVTTALCHSDMLSISEAQYHRDNRPERFGELGFFVSYGSPAWKDRLMEVVRLFVQTYGYNWVVLEEPVWKADIPGTRDRLHRLFLRTYPGLEYPEAAAETPAYLRLQQLKCEAVVDFYRNLTNGARSAGAERVGVVLEPFLPTSVGSGSPQSLACANGRLAALPGVDFVVAPIRRESGAAVSPYAGSPALLCYAEILAHSTGKPVIAATSQPEKYQAAPQRVPMPDDLSCSSAMWSIAAAPNGIICDWHGPESTEDEDRSRMVRNANRVLSRFGHQRSPLALVFSPSTCRHGPPHDSESALRFYWTIARQVLLTVGIPMLTFSADVLKEQLAMNPQVKLLVLEEHSPLDPCQVSTVLNWWNAEPGRAIIVVGSGMGFSADPDKPGKQPLSEAFPGLLERIGICQLDPPSIRRDEPASINLRQCGTIKLSLPAESADLRVESTANVQRIFAAGSQAMYCDGDRRPVITRRCSGKTAAYFCGLGAAPDMAPIIGEIIRHAGRWIGVMQPPIRTTGESVFWNGTTGGYIVAANCSDSPSNITIVYKPCTYWDVIQQRLVGEADACTALAPHSIRVLRRVAKRSKLYDVDGATRVHSIADGACRAELTLDTGPKTTLIVRCPPGEVLVDSLRVETSVELCEGYSKVRLRGVEPGRHVVTLRW